MVVEIEKCWISPTHVIFTFVCPPGVVTADIETAGLAFVYANDLSAAYGRQDKSAKGLTLVKELFDDFDSIYGTHLCSHVSHMDFSSHVQCAGEALIEWLRGFGHAGASTDMLGT